jgi:hypothetical protein
MSHDSIVEAAVQAAARSGAQATVIVVGASNGVPAHTHDQYDDHYAAPRNTAPVPPPPAEVPVPAASSYTNDEVVSKLQAAEKQIQEMVKALAQRDQVISELQQAAEKGVAVMSQATPGDQPQQPTDVVSIDAYEIDCLGIGDESIVRKLKKSGYTTIGQVRQGFNNLKDLKLKGGQKTIIDIAERLLGKIPAATGAGGATQVQPAATAVAVADGVPEGHSDRAWLDRLGAVKAKERDMRDEVAKMEAIRKEHPDENQMPDEVYDSYQQHQHEYDMARSQVIALVWGLGLEAGPFKQGGNTATVDDCLRASGLAHLCDEPAPVPAAG